MPQLATGTALSQQISFNSGTFDINGFEVATLQDITITLAFSTKEIRQLGSIIMATAPKRSTFKPSAKAKTKSVNPALYTFFMGSSGADGQGFDYSVLDGQNVLTRATVNCFVNENTADSIQFQFTNAILAGNFALALKMEDAAELDFELQAQNVTMVTSANFQ